MNEAELENLKDRITTLRVEHHDLDAVIARMEERGVFEDDQLHRLKKKKLALKDQIAQLERRLAVTTH